MTLSYWLDQPYGQSPSLSESRTADAVVLGAGMTGVVLGHFLTRRGLRTLLLERGVVAGGATGRNAGFIISGLGEHYSQSSEFWGREPAASITRMHQENHAIVAQLINELEINCGYKKCGSLAVAVEEQEAGHLRRSAALMQQDGFACQLQEAVEIAHLVHGRRFLAGLFNPDDGAVNPVQLTRGIAARGHKFGLEVFEDTRVSGITRVADGWSVNTITGSVTAPLVFLALNAWGRDLAPLLPIEPIRGECLAFSGVSPRMPEIPCFTNYGSEYWRGVDGNALFGGMRRVAHGEAHGLSDCTTGSVQGAIHEFALNHFPHLERCRISHRWSGTMAYTRDGLPIVGELKERPGIFYSGGYTGHGFGYAFLAARWLVELAIDKIDAIHPLCRADRQMRSSPSLDEI